MFAAFLAERSKIEVSDQTHALLARLEDMEKQWSDVREALRKGADLAAWADC